MASEKILAQKEKEVEELSEKIKAAKKIGIPPFSATVIVIRKKRNIFG